MAPAEEPPKTTSYPFQKQSKPSPAKKTALSVLTKPEINPTDEGELKSKMSLRSAHPQPPSKDKNRSYPT